MTVKKSLNPVILLFGVITFFVFLVSFAVFYTTENFSTACGCMLPPWVVIVSMASLGLFVGIITYYILSSHFLKEKTKIEKNLTKVLDIMEEEDSKILKILITAKGETTQSRLLQSAEIDKVKLSRILSKMESKGILKKEKNGMTNRIILNPELSDLFKKD